MGVQKGGSAVTENPELGVAKSLEGFRGGTTQICLENEDMGVEGSRQKSKVIKGDHFGELTFKGEIG